MNKIRTNIKALGKSDSAKIIAKEVLKMINK
jgi:hypothetical protein